MLALLEHHCNFFLDSGTCTQRFSDCTAFGFYRIQSAQFPLCVHLRLLNITFFRCNELLSPTTEHSWNTGGVAETVVRRPNQYSILFSLLSETRGNWERTGSTACYFSLECICGLYTSLSLPWSMNMNLILFNSLLSHRSLFDGR